MQEKLKEYENEVESIKTELKTLFQDNEAITYNGTTLSTYKTSNVTRIDSKRLKADFPAIAEKCSVTSTERKLLIKKI